MRDSNCPQPADIDLAVGGRTDTCAFCGIALDTSASVGAVGLDALICPDCAGNLHVLTPAWGGFALTGNTTLTLHHYWGHPRQQDGTQRQCTFLEPSNAHLDTPSQLYAYYHGLTTDTKQLVWAFTTEWHPDDYTTTPKIVVDRRDLISAFEPYSDTDADNPARSLVKRVPRPFLATPDRVVYPATATIDIDTLTTHRTDQGDIVPSQQHLTDHDTGPSNGSGSDRDTDDAGTTATDTTSTQTGLPSFE
jgi:hypothetical protein